MALTLVTAPAVEPVTVAEAKAHLRVDLDDEDDMIARLIAAARQAGEDFTGRTFVTQTWRVTTVRPPAGAIDLPRPPLQSVVSVEAVDADGVAADWPAESWFVDTDVARLVPKAGAPSGMVRVTYVAGFGDSGDDVPAALRQAILVHAAALFEHRGDDRMPAAARALYRPWRVVGL